MTRCCADDSHVCQVLFLYVKYKKKKKKKKKKIRMSSAAVVISDLRSNDAK